MKLSVFRYDVGPHGDNGLEPGAVVYVAVPAPDNLRYQVVPVKFVQLDDSEIPQIIRESIEMAVAHQVCY